MSLVRLGRCPREDGRVDGRGPGVGDGRDVLSERVVS